MIMFPYTRLPREEGESVPDSWGISITPTGWMNGDVFVQWMANHFIPYLENEKVEFPIILFVDGHRSHLTMHLSELCEAKGVILVALLPNCTHMLQPADVSVFAPLKKGWQAYVRECKFNNDYRQVVSLIMTTNRLLSPTLPQSFKMYSRRELHLLVFKMDSENVGFTLLKLIPLITRNA